MCCKSWKTFFPFCVTFLLGVLAAIPFQTLRTELKFREVRNELVSNHKNGTEGTGHCFTKSHSSELNCFACEKGTIARNDEKSVLQSNLNPLQIVSKPRANYTDAARNNQTEGTVTLRVTFLANGEIGNVSMVKYLPDGLAEQAIEAAKQIKFEPATLNGKPVTVTKQVQYSFSLY